MRKDNGGPRDRRRPRLTSPLIRRSDEFVTASWDEALGFAAAGLTEVKERHGASALGMFSCSKASNETNFLAQKFARTVLGTNNIDSCNRT